MIPNSGDPMGKEHTEDSKLGNDPLPGEFIERLVEEYRVGYFNYPGRLEGLKKDPELGALRGRQDFQQLVALVEQGKTSGIR